MSVRRSACEPCRKRKKRCSHESTAGDSESHPRVIQSDTESPPPTSSKSTPASTPEGPRKKPRTSTSAAQSTIKCPGLRIGESPLEDPQDGPATRSHTTPQRPPPSYNNAIEQTQPIEADKQPAGRPLSPPAADQSQAGGPRTLLSEFVLLAKEVDAERESSRRRMADLAARVASVTAERDHARTQHASCIHETKELEARNEELEARNKGLETQIGRLETENRGVLALESTKDRKIELLENVADLQREAAANLVQKIKKAKGEFLAVEEQIEELENDLEGNMQDPAYQLPTFPQVLRTVRGQDNRDIDGEES